MNFESVYLAAIDVWLLSAINIHMNFAIFSRFLDFHNIQHFEIELLKMKMEMVGLLSCFRLILLLSVDLDFYGLRAIRRTANKTFYFIAIREHHIIIELPWAMKPAQIARLSS